MCAPNPAPPLNQRFNSFIFNSLGSSQFCVQSALDSIKPIIYTLQNLHIHSFFHRTCGILKQGIGPSMQIQNKADNTTRISTATCKWRRQEFNGSAGWYQSCHRQSNENLSSELQIWFHSWSLASDQDLVSSEKWHRKLSVNNLTNVVTAPKSNRSRHWPLTRKMPKGKKSTVAVKVHWSESAAVYVGK